MLCFGSSNTQCTKCSAGNYYYSATFTCDSSCPDGYFENSNNSIEYISKKKKKNKNKGKNKKNSFFYEFLKNIKFTNIVCAPCVNCAYCQSSETDCTKCSGDLYLKAAVYPELG